MNDQIYKNWRKDVGTDYETTRRLVDEDYTRANISRNTENELVEMNEKLTGATTMNDRELIELAAKAAGIEYKKHSNCVVVEGIPRNWNPLTDDGDALRLAVRLGIDVQQFVDSRMVEAWKHPHQACGEDYGADPYAATRRAIVRAAAEIGKQQEQP